MISVIISTYNNESTISHAIKSILNQKYHKFELIIVNDGSTDKTDEIIQSFNDSRIIYFKNARNFGRSYSRNLGINKSKGKFIAIMDGDDISLPNRLGLQLSYLKNNPNIDVVASNVIYFYENRVLGVSTLSLSKLNIVNFFVRASRMPHPTWMARANFFKKFKYEPKMDKSEDTDLLIRAHLSCRYAILNKFLVFYRLPYKTDTRYKLKQIYLLFLSRTNFIYDQKLFHYFPLILSALLISSFYYIFKCNPNKMKNFLNSKYQKLFDKITKNKQIKIVNIISADTGGGAEVVVNELDKTYLNKNLNSYVIYFGRNKNSSIKSHFYLKVNARNPIGIFYIRKILKEMLYSTNKEIIVHAHLTWPFFYTVFAVLGLKNLKLFFTEHSTTNKRRKIPFFYLVEKLFYSKYLKIICISKGVRKELNHWVGPQFKRRLKTIYNGSRLYQSFKRPDLIGRLPRLISIGSLKTIKNFPTVINAISKLKYDIESYTIIGEGSQRKKIKKLIKELRLENKVKLLGWVEKVEQYLHKSDIHIIPSLNEGFGLVATEAMSTGLPVVASNIEGLREVLGTRTPSVILVNKIESSEEWKKKIYYAIYKCKKLGSKKIGKFSTAHVKKFTFNKMAQEYLKMYSNN